MIIVGRNVVLGIASAGLLLFSGCGTRDYNSLADRGAAILRSEAKFKGLYAPTPIPETPFAIRVPVIYLESYKADSSHPDDGDQIRPERMQPPFLPLDGLRLTYESRAEVGGKKLPYYCYLAAVPAQPGDADKMADAIAAKLKQAFPETGDWEPVDVDTPDVKALHWRKIRATGEQPFFTKMGDQVTAESLPGIFELWLHDAEDYVVLVGWRAPDQIEGPQTDDVRITGPLALPADNAKPDFSKWPPATAGTLTRDSE